MLTDNKIKMEILPTEKHSVYVDIVNLPNTIQFGLTVKVYNNDDIGLYLQMTGAATGYSFVSTNLGLVASGANYQKNIDQFFSRGKPAAGDLPSGELTEIVTLSLKAYTDSGYTSLKWTYDRQMHIYWINSSDAAFTVNQSDDFDDGTVQGWAVANESNNYVSFPQLFVVSDYVLSSPYSIEMVQTPATGAEFGGRLYKSFTTPNKTSIYAIFNVRQGRDSAYAWSKNLRFKQDDTTLVFLGWYNDQGTHGVPINKWIRVTVPLPANTTVEIRIIQFWWENVWPSYVRLWLDDFKIISK